MTRSIVVIGAGGAGAPLAARLSEDPGRHVTLIEAGSAEATPQDLLDGGSLVGALPTHPDTWSYTGDLGRGRQHTVVRGRRLGGSTATNGGYFVLPTRADLDRWAAAGGAHWSDASALALLEQVSKLAEPTPQTGSAAQAFHAAALELGYPDEPDKNAGSLPGVGPVPSNIIDGVRVNTGMAYLDDPRPNLEIRGNTTAHRINFTNGRVTGVDTGHGTIAADEVVVSCGAIETAKLLLLSGIGPAADLHTLGIPLVKDLPVGESFSDHPNVVLEWQARAPVVDWSSGYGFTTALNIDASTVDPTLPSIPEGDAEVMLTAKPIMALLTGTHDSSTHDTADVLHLFIAAQHHRGQGKLTLSSSDPAAPPQISYRYFELAEDLQRMRASVRTAWSLLHTNAFASVFSRVTNLSAETISDDLALDAWILQEHGTALHTCATAPMGSVTDGFGRVHGVTGLRVADTSILPSAPHRGPAASAVFVGELIARHMSG